MAACCVIHTLMSWLQRAEAVATHHLVKISLIIPLMPQKTMYHLGRECRAQTILRRLHVVTVLLATEQLAVCVQAKSVVRTIAYSLERLQAWRHTSQMRVQPCC